MSVWSYKDSRRSKIMIHQKVMSKVTFSREYYKTGFTFLARSDTTDVREWVNVFALHQLETSLASRVASSNLE